jgi:hypothetical protein
MFRNVSKFKCYEKKTDIFLFNVEINLEHNWTT